VSKEVWLVCGGRHYEDVRQLMDFLSRLIEIRGTPTIVIEGGAMGADLAAKDWATSNGIHVATVEALWNTFGPAAGPMRNQAMLVLRPDVVIAAPGGKGTQNMVDAAKKAGVEVLLVP
jgi:predicted Rossmann-fold nucleotide-binding protein